HPLVYLYYVSIIFTLFFFLYKYYHHRDLHSFPTRRSSDLGTFGWGMFNCALAAGMLSEAAAQTTAVTGEVIPSDVPGLLAMAVRSEEHTSELQSHLNLVCRLLLEKKKNTMYRLECCTRLRA